MAQPIPELLPLSQEWLDEMEESARESLVFSPDAALALFAEIRRLKTLLRPSEK